MKHRVAVTAFLVAGLFSAQVLLGATGGGVKGRVLVSLQGFEGIPLTLVNVATGKSFSVRTTKDGFYSLSLPNGSYVVSSPGIRGLSIGKAPLLIQVTAGRYASANIELAPARVQDASGGTAIFHNPIGCVSSNEFPVFDIAFRPAGSVVSARLYFKSNLSDEWFYTEFQALTGNFPKYKWTMAPDPANPSATIEGDDIRREWVDFNEPKSIDPGVPATHRAFLPKVQEGSGITEVTYYIQITLADFTESRIPEIPTRVLPKGQACKGGAFAAPAGAPGNLAVLTSGGLAGAPAGMGTLGFSLAAEAAVAGAGLVPLVVAEGTTPGADPTPTPTTVVGPSPTPTANPDATPGPTPIATPTPTPNPTGPTPTPTPTPTPIPGPTECQVQVSVSPPGGAFNPCAAQFSSGSGTTTVTSSQTFTVLCDSNPVVSAKIGPPASFVGPVAASWGGVCSGDAISKTCNLSSILPSLSTVVLECGCDPSIKGFASTCGGPTPTPFEHP